MENPGQFRVEINTSGKFVVRVADGCSGRIYVGRYDTIEEAVRERDKAERNLPALLEMA